MCSCPQPEIPFLVGESGDVFNAENSVFVLLRDALAQSAWTSSGASPACSLFPRDPPREPPLRSFPALPSLLCSLQTSLDLEPPFCTGALAPCSSQLTRVHERNATDPEVHSGSCKTDSEELRGAMKKTGKPSTKSISISKMEPWGEVSNRVTQRRSVSKPVY